MNAASPSRRTIVRTSSGSIGTPEVIAAPTMNASIAFWAGPNTPRTRLSSHHIPIVPTRSAPERSILPPIAPASAGAGRSAGAIATAVSPIRSASPSAGPRAATTRSPAPYGSTTTARFFGRRSATSARSGVRSPTEKKRTASAADASVERSGEAELLPERRNELLDLHPDLGHGVPLADRDGLVGQ